MPAAVVSAAMAMSHEVVVAMVTAVEVSIATMVAPRGKMVVPLAVMIVAMILGVVVVMMTAVMVPAVPAFATTEAEPEAELKADDIPAGTIPVIVVPAVGFSVPGEFVVVAGRRIDNDRRHAADAFDLQPRPPSSAGTSRHKVPSPLVPGLLSLTSPVQSKASRIRPSRLI